jgi:Uma2 family endonuclease
VVTARAITPDRIRPLRRVEYESLVERGLFEDAHVELLLGSLVETTPQGPLHADVVRRLAERLIRELPGTVQTRTHSPLVVSDDSVPEPDIAVVTADDYRAKHPTSALIVIEVAETSLLKDRGIKAALYATAGIPEFWLVNLTECIVEVHRRPVAGRYEDVVRIGRDGRLTPEAFPVVRIPLEDVLA